MSMRITQTNSYLSTKNTIQYTGNQNTPKHGSNKNNSKILISGTNTDKNRQTNSTKKQNSLENMMEEMKTAAEDYGKLLTEKLEHSKKAARKFFEMLNGSTEELEKIREEKADQNHQTQDSDGAKVEKPEAAAGANTSSYTKISSEITDSAVAAESAYSPISAYQTPASSLNSNIDVML